MRVSSFKIDCLGYQLDADYYDNDGDTILLSLIGWTSNRGNYKDILEGVCRRVGLDALVFDYTGHGDSDFPLEKTRPAQHFLEVICVYDWLRNKYPSKQIYVMGTSYGGYMAALLSQYRPVEKQVIRVPGLYKPDDFYSFAPDWRTDTLFEYRKNPELVARNIIFKQARNYKGQTFVVVHELDEQIPAAVTDNYINAYNAESYVAKGMYHSISSETPREEIEKYQEAISDWLSK